ncbi:uncharacterized protein LOC144653345 [Oculina patagonica]
MATRKLKESRIRRWSNVEIMLFAKILVNTEHSFLFQLESKALKKSSNNQIFADIKKIYDEQLAIDEVTQKIRSEIGEWKFNAQPSIKTSISKLRIKYKWMKDQRRKYNYRIKSGDMKLAAIEKPEWLKILDPGLTQTNAELMRVGTVCDVDGSADESKSSDNEEESMLDSGCGDLPTFCALRSEKRLVDNSMTWDEENESDFSAHSTDAGLLNEGKNSQPTANEGSKEVDVNKSVEKSCVAEKEATSPVKVMSRKRKVTVISGHEQALCDLSESIQKMNESIEKRMALMIDEGKARDEAFMKFHEKQCELNRQHELRMMEMMLRFVQPRPPQAAYNIPPGESVPIQAYRIEPSGENSLAAGGNAAV